MADYTTLSDASVGIGGIPSGTTVTALRDNPIAIAEGATGAPRVTGAATFPGGAFVKAFEASTSSQTITTANSSVNLDLVGVLRIDGNIGGNASSARALSIELSANGGTTWATAVSLVSLSSGTTQNARFHMHIDFATGKVNGVAYGTSQALINTDFAGEPFNAVRLTTSSAGQMQFLATCLTRRA